MTFYARGVWTGCTSSEHTKDKRIRTKVQTTIYKTLHRKLKIEQREPHKKPSVNSGAPEWLAVPAIRRVNVKRHEHYLIWKSCWTQVYFNKYK